MSERIMHRIDKIDYIDIIKEIDAKNVTFKDIVTNQVNTKKEKVFCIRHDITDKNELTKALSFAKVEKDNGIRSTYFLLHTADYFDYSKELIYVSQYFNQLGHDVGISNNSYTVWLESRKSQSFKKILSEPLSFLRGNGIEVLGSSSYVFPLYKGLKYYNYEMWSEFDPVKNEYFTKLDHPKISLKDLGLLYEAYFIENDTYFSNFGLRWNGYRTTKGRQVPSDVSLLSSNKNCGKAVIAAFNANVGGGILQVAISPTDFWWVIF